MKKKPKKTTAPRKNAPPKTRCSGTWTEARYKAFIVSALRKASMKWKPKWDAIDRTFIANGKNPKTGRPCKLHRCESCHRLVAKGDMKADHIHPVIDPAKGFEGWDRYVSRMFVEADGYQAICETCHDTKTTGERAERSVKLSPVKAIRLRTRKKV